MQELLLAIWEAERKTVLFVTHDIEEAIFMANRVVVMTRASGPHQGRRAGALPHPRHYTVKTTPEFSALKAQLTEEIARRRRCTRSRKRPRGGPVSAPVEPPRRGAVALHMPSPARHLRTRALVLGASPAARGGLARATPDEQAQREIDHLLDFVAASNCTFVRNGEAFRVRRGARSPARKYASRKYRLSTADEFVRYLATESSSSGEPYKMICGKEGAGRGPLARRGARALPPGRPNGKHRRASEAARGRGADQRTRFLCQRHASAQIASSRACGFHPSTSRARAGSA